jgi:hypothetical protein
MSEKAATSSQKDLNTSDNSTNSQPRSETVNLFQGSQYEQPAPSSGLQIESIPDFFADNHNDIRLSLKKYSEDFVQSEKAEQAIMDDLDRFYQYVLEYEGHLVQRLKAYHDKIARFSKGVVTTTATPGSTDFSSGV